MSPASAYRVIDLVNNLEQHYLSHEDEAVRVLAILQGQAVFKDVLNRYQQDIVRAYTAPYSDRELTRVIKTIFSEIREAPHLYERDVAQKEDAQIIEEAAGRAKELKDAEETVKTTIQKIKTKRTGVNRTFVERAFIEGAVRDYVKNLKEEERALVAKEISGKVVNALENNPTIAAGRVVKTALLESFPDASPDTVERIAKDSSFEELEKSYGESIETIVGTPVVFSEKPEDTANAVAEIIDKSRPASTPSELVSITRDAGELAEPVAKAIKKGTDLEKLSKDEKERVIEETSRSFLTTIGSQKTATAIAGTFTTVFGQDPVNEALGNIFAKNTAAIEANPQALSGKAFPLTGLKKSIESATGGEIKQPSPAPRRVPSFVVRASQAAVNPFFKKNSQAFQVIAWYTAITGKQFQDDIVPFLLDAAKSPWKNILSFGAKTAAKKGAEIAAQKTAKTGLGKLLSALFGTLIAGPAGTIMGFIGHKILEPLISIGLKLFGGAFSSLWNGISGQITNFSNQPPGKYEWIRDWPLVFAFFVIAFIGVPLIVPNLLPSLGFSNSMFQKQGQDSWQIVMISKGEAGGGGAEAESEVDLQNNPQARAQKILSQKRSSQILSLTVPPPIQTCSQVSGGVCVEFTAGPAGEVRDSCGSGASSSNWTDGEWQMVQQVLSDLNKSSSFMGYVNDGNPISIYRTRTDFGGGCFLHGSEKSSIVLYNGAFSSPNLLRYTLAHELGHAISYSSPELYNSFYSSGIMETEGYLPSYPNKKMMSPTEDFAETLGLYAFYRNSRNYTDYPSAFPNHYNFAEKVFSGTVY